MKRFGGRTAVVLATGVAAFATGSSVASAAQPVQDTLRGVDRVVKNVQGQLDQTIDRTTKRVLRQPQAQRQAPAQAPGASPRGASPSGPGGYQPPLHGTNPHGQGTVATTDLAPGAQRPLSGNPSGAQPQPQNNEDVVAGRALGEKDAQGYHGHITIAALLGNELVGVDTRPGQTASGPLEAVQQGVLDGLCTASTLCLTALQADSSTTASSTTNRFAVATASVGATGMAPGIGAGVAQSRGDASEDANCQNTSGSSSVANANVGTVTAGAANSASSSRSCRDGSGSQTGSGRVLSLNNGGVPVPAPGCGIGTETVTGVPGLLPIVCNATDLNGVGETVTQAAQRYGVREALSVFVVDVGGISLAKLTTSGSESRSQAPAGPATPPVVPGSDDTDDDDRPRRRDDDRDRRTGGPSGPGGPGGPGDGPGDRASQCSDGIDNDGDGRVDFPNDPGCSSPSDDSEANELAFTGMNVLFVLGLGLLFVPVGLQLRAAVRLSKT